MKIGSGIEIIAGQPIATFQHNEYTVELFNLQSSIHAIVDLEDEDLFRSIGVVLGIY